MTIGINRRLRLLYLGNAFPPGWGGRLVHNHIYSGEVFLIQKLSRFAEVSSVGLLLKDFWPKRFEPTDDSPGLEHELMLYDFPGRWHRWISWRKLRRYYLEKVKKEGMPDVLIVRNLQHVFNHFVQWLRRQPKRPVIVLLLGDSGGLDKKVNRWRRLRYKLKPIQMLEVESVLMYDAAILSGISAKRYFERRGIPWVWHPAVYKFEYTPPPPGNENGPIRFGYFGRLIKGYAAIQVVQIFLKAGIQGTLHVCGCGDQAEELEKLAKLHPNFHFDGFLAKESDCLDWAQKVDVLINSRLPVDGQENSFPSKILEYGIAGKAILSTRVGGVYEAIGEDGIYFDAENFEESLLEKIREVSAMNRDELQRRAQAIRRRILSEFNADEQARRVFEFLNTVVKLQNTSNALP
jgi:glycosyltransferase involved in cell wall biosynthesis